MSRLKRIYFNHLSSYDVLVIEQYSTSTVDQDNIWCFLVIHDIGEQPKKVIKPLRKRQVMGQPFQSASHQIYNIGELESDNDIGKQPLPPPHE